MDSHATNVTHILSLFITNITYGLGIFDKVKYTTLGNVAGGDAVSKLKQQSNHICARVSACFFLLL